MLEIKNVKKSFGKQEVLKDVSLRVEKGDVIVILVENVHLAESIMTLSYRIHSHNQ